MAPNNWVNIGSADGLLPNGTKPSAEPMSIDHQRGIVTLRTNSQEMLKISVLDISLKITDLIL